MNLYLNDTLLEFKINTGAEVTVIPESVATPHFSVFYNILHKDFMDLGKFHYKSVDSLQEH